MKKLIITFSVVIFFGLFLVLCADTISNLISPQQTATVTATPSPSEEPTVTPEPTDEPEEVVQTTEIELVADNFSYDDDGVLVYTDAYVGIDVSSYQGDIDWEKVAADGIDFAIIRLGYRGATEGGLYEDKYFEQNIAGAIDAGVKVGVYFYSQAITREEAEEEANFVIERIADYQITYPVCFDWEYTNITDSRVEDMIGEEVSYFATGFLNVISEAGYETAIYMTDASYNNVYDIVMKEDYNIWYSDFEGIADVSYGYKILQHSCTGSVDGIYGNVDLNISFVEFE